MTAAGTLCSDSINPTSVRPPEHSVEAHANELQEECMKLYVLPPSPRALKVIALKNYLGKEGDKSDDEAHDRNT